MVGGIPRGLKCRAHCLVKALRRLSCVMWDNDDIFSWSGMVSVQRLCFVNFGKIGCRGESPQKRLCLQVTEDSRLAEDGWEPGLSEVRMEV